MYQRLVSVLTLAALAVLPAGAVAAGPPPGPGPVAAARLAPLWTGTPRAGDIGAGPAYAGGSVYYVEDAFPVSSPRSGNRLTRRDAATGRLLPFAAPVSTALFLAPPVTDGTRVFTADLYEGGSTGAHVLAYTLAGRRLWSGALTGDQFLTTLVVTGRLVIAAAESGCDRPDQPCRSTTVYAWTAATGRPVWHRTLPGGNPSMVAAAGRLAVALAGSAGSPAGSAGSPVLTALDVPTGRQLWRLDGAGDGALAVDARNVYVAAGALCAYGAADGRRRWCVTDRRYHDVTVADGLLYTAADAVQGGDDPRIVAFSTGGRTRWAVPGSPTGPLAAAAGVVYFQHFPLAASAPADQPTVLLALRGSTGGTLARLPVGSGFSGGPVAVGGGRIFTIAYLTAVLAYAPKP